MWPWKLDRGGVSSGVGSGRVRKSAVRVLVVVMSGAAVTVAGCVAVGILNADGMPWVMSGRAERVRPDVLPLWCQRWNVCRLTLSGDVWPRVRQQVRPYECGLHGEGCHASGPVLWITFHELPGRRAEVIPGRRAEVIPGTRHALYIVAAYMVHGLHGLFGYIFTDYMHILQTTR